MSFKTSRMWFSSSTKYYNEKKREEIDAKRKEIMARGLPKQKPIAGVKQILLVASGKGGVGKSTTAVNLSTAIKTIAPNKSVGLLDADVFGPSIPLMMNLHDTPLLNEENQMEPLINYGIKCMSMGFLVDEKSPVIWRGLMVMSALERLIRQTAWGPLDYLIVDTPPGTGDTHLSLIQNLPLSGVLLVTTPQNAALQVTRRGAAMLKKMNVPIAGVVENMSSVTCPECSHEVKLFGSGTEILAKDLGIEFLRKIPLDRCITENCDDGKPIVLSMPESSPANAYRSLGRSIIEFLKKQPINNT
ncbi:iron-sulfur protein NUBPL isoform X2 [Athalia rosae]|uniref:iron-sulfur protein NUBPL isoform X2 n=1 Tax=Athalia rosae TaxID=37344 RepID=UPI002033F702|nr:iron-sulfur protein NUBPL isoform X2 [Athalia rosae]XP_020707347.2 iron-sulfur protein NUBPL isoform X2 [Athalia rosae]